MKIHVCEDCGKSYRGGKFSKYCAECRKKRQAPKKRETGGIMVSFVAPYPGKPIPMGLKTRQVYENKRKARQPGKLEKYENCPNFDRESISCVSCPLGAYKFKACGRVKCSLTVRLGRCGPSATIQPGVKTAHNTKDG